MSIIRFALLIVLVFVMQEAKAAPKALSDVKSSTADFVGDLLESLSHYVRGVISGGQKLLPKFPAPDHDSHIDIRKKDRTNQLRTTNQNNQNDHEILS